MNKDQKAGALIVVVALTLIAVALALAQGWGRGSFLYYSYWEGPELGGQWVFIPVGYVLAPLVVVVGYGVVRYLSLIPPIFRRRPNSSDKDA